MWLPRQPIDSPRDETAGHLATGLQRKPRLTVGQENPDTRRTTFESCLRRPLRQASTPRETRMRMLSLTLLSLAAMGAQAGTAYLG